MPLHRGFKTGFIHFYIKITDFEWIVFSVFP